MRQTLLSLDYVLENPHAARLPTEDEKVNALTAGGSRSSCCRTGFYQGAVGAQYRYFSYKLPLVLDEGRATFLSVQTDEDKTVSAVRTWGSQHSALAVAGRAAEVVVVGSDRVRLAAGRVLDQWAATPPESVTPSQQEAAAAAELAAIYANHPGGANDSAVNSPASIARRVSTSAAIRSAMLAFSVFSAFRSASMRSSISRIDSTARSNSEAENHSTTVGRCSDPWTIPSSEPMSNRTRCLQRVPPTPARQLQAMPRFPESNRRTTT